VAPKVPVLKKIVKTTIQRRIKPDEPRKKKYDELQSKVAHLEQENEEIESLRQELKEYKAKDVTSTAQLKKLQADLQKATSTSSAMSMQNQQVWDKVSEKNVEIQFWRQKLNDAEQQKKTIEQQHADLTCKYDELEKQYRNDTIPPKEELPVLQADKAMHDSVVESLKEQVRRIG
jgi:chromosome segregation ATPase